MSELNKLLKEMHASLDATSEAINKLETVYENPSQHDDIAKHLKVDENVKVSLLSLKNGSMLSYLSALLSIIDDKMDTKVKDPTASKGRERSIENRIVLERGVKPLEKKLGYQLDKLVRSYTRTEKEYKDAEKRVTERDIRSTTKSNRENSDDEEEEVSSSDEDDELSYRPNMINAKSQTNDKSKSTRETKSGSNDNNEETKEEDQENDGIYRPPKINAMLPPQTTTHFEDKFSVKDHKDRSSHSKMQAMEEYIKDQSEQPDWGTSIGADILDHGRGGIKSSRDTEKERRVTTFEEDNFTRVNHMGMNKTERKKQKQRQRNAKANVIGGEDFGIFNSKRKMEDSTSRRSNKKPRSAWDRAKKRM
ncbi:similar to Saccharomyces cerevisiae YER127W LCP5 Essential protein involved in maturation of 18S rRNA [Maudiozyma saulgeensis]|uniref:Similar to Saccharomyces cerevisiae YER127W LCP5 Essential protein involved in maturation of 18S rRNA n=1 Tax=Maudiozyma saulgeensis TaxID=1789683 RepID=A0A1X7R0W1_9SACH|nr:similar to Saccharomyces cerevisiae YER127W LCP5 Essential protein involved in maturation of 18S rRNA [Kazachstania saulgeensis]